VVGSGVERVCEGGGYFGDDLGGGRGGGVVKKTVKPLNVGAKI